MTLTPEDISAIADAVVSKLQKEESKTVTMEEAAKILNLRITTKRSLSATFTKFSDPRKYKKPLTAHYIGKERGYKRADVYEFLENRRRN
jgi:hypothetical protein